MEIFLLVVLILLGIWAIILLTGSSSQLKKLQEDVRELRAEFRRSLEKKEPSASEAPRPAQPVPAKPAPVQKPVFTKPATPPPTPKPEPAPTPPPLRRWRRDNPDLERFIGENLFNKVGISVLVLGIAFFVKYAIDQEWIGEIGRVCIGLFCGALLLGVAHRLRKGYHSFSSVLVGGGISVFYFTIAFAFHQYQLISQVQAFAAMVVITIFAILLSVLYDRMELGILATLGGFITPFLVSKGEGNYEVLFTYLCILNAGLIVLAYFKRWRVLNFLAFVFTQVIYLGWMIGNAGTTTFPYMGAFVFGAIFYVMFLVMNIIHHALRSSRLLAFDFIILLSVNFAWYGAGIYLLVQGGHAPMKGLFTLLLGVINLVLAYLFLRKKSVDKNFVYLLLGITLSFLSLTAPVQLKGHYITLFWATETVVLFWLYQKSFIRLLKIASALITLLTIISLFMDWGQVYGFITTPPPVIANKGCITGLFCASCLLINYSLAKKEGDLYYLGLLTNRMVRTILLTGALALYFISGALEIYVQFSRRFAGTGLEFTYLQLWVAVYGLFLFLFLRRKNGRTEPILLILLPLGLLFLYVTNIHNIYTTETKLLLSGEYRGYFLANWAGDIVLLALVWLLIRYVRGRIATFQQLLSPFSWILSIGLLILFSVEIRHVFVWLCYSDPSSIPRAEDLYGKAGLSILWGICSFLLIAIGMAHRYKPLRVIALVLFGVTLLKLFCYDITNISPAGKIIAFILLGVLLLIISFMYQRLKKILLNDAPGST